MTIFGFLILLLVAAVIGSIGSAIAGYSSRGCLTSIAIGLIGAIIGSWLSRELKIGEVFVFQGLPVIWSIIGAAIFVAVINLLSGSQKRTPRKRKS
ncbi:MAG TPA: GlsB/YeaQ/YmgE family stress response membrane protein [bacterium]|nr:GlsB/YeaQ/YmgE family stress response membrane protein [bacterium]